jgi:CRISPR-associated protein Csd2
MSTEIEDVILPAGEAEEEVRTDDVALRPGPNADPSEEVVKYISQDIRDLYDVFSYRHAAAILYSSFASELSEIEDALRKFKITTKEIGMPGGNESDIPKKFSEVLRPLDWKETRIQGDFLIRLLASSKKLKKVTEAHWKQSEQRTIENAIDGHKIDYVKGRVAFDLEWNSKDQTFDRDLYAFRLFHECGVISVATLVTRSALIEPIFDKIPRRNKKTGEIEYNTGGDEISAGDKFGASTTWMGKLLYRLNAGRHGGCPVLVFGIRPNIISDWDMETGSIRV